MISLIYSLKNVYKNATLKTDNGRLVTSVLYNAFIMLWIGSIDYAFHTIALITCDNCSFNN